MSLVRLSRPVMLCLAIPLVSFLAMGCAPKVNPKRVLPQPPPAKDNDRWAREAAQRLRDLDRESAHLTEDVRALPGQDAAEHSQMMRRVFADLLRTLPLLANPATDRILAQRMSIIDNSRSQLANTAASLAIEPAIDTALRAAAAALGDISHGENYQQGDVGVTLDKLSAELNRLDTERDNNLHRVDVAETSDLISQIVNKLAAAISGKITGVAAPPTTAPAIRTPPPAIRAPAPPASEPAPAAPGAPATPAAPPAPTSAPAATTGPASQPATTQPAAAPDAK